MNNYIPVIGLEIHVELATESGMFCNCSVDWFGKEPNVNTCPVCLGLPGALPVPNKKAIEWCQRIGKALDCPLAEYSKFDRKHYFYPDLPKGYQITQYDVPFCYDGEYEFLSRASGQQKRIRIRRVHMEEDTGKLIHENGDTLIDFNRSGVPLVEIVTEPDFDNSDDVKQFLEELQIIIRYLGVSDADMEKGSMRLEPNISVRRDNQKELPAYKVEVKNINSFKFAKNAIDFEIKRHIKILEKGETPVQETRGYYEAKGSTVSQRVKEEAHDYRYFPEPDIPPFNFDRQYLDQIGKNLPELPHEKVQRYVRDFNIKYQDAYILTRDMKTAQYFEEIIREGSMSQSSIPNAYQNFASALINKKISSDITPKSFASEAMKIYTQKTTDPNDLKESINAVLKQYSSQVTDYKSGKVNIIMFLVGQVMKEMNGQADPQTVKKELEKLLHS